MYIVQLIVVIKFMLKRNILSIDGTGFVLVYYNT